MNIYRHFDEEQRRMNLQIFCIFKEIHEIRNTTRQTHNNVKKKFMTPQKSRVSSDCLSVNFKVKLQQ